MVKVRLRMPQQADVAAHAGRPVSEEIHRMYGGQPGQMPGRSEKLSQGWLDWLIAHPYARIIEVDGHAAGEIRLHSLSEHDRSARLAIGLFSEDLLGQGIGRTAVREALDHAFGPMRLHRIDLKVLAYNARAIACYRACSFVHEGTLRDAVKIGDRWHDEWIMAVLASEYRTDNSKKPHGRGPQSNN